MIYLALYFLGGISMFIFGLVYGINDQDEFKRLKSMNRRIDKERARAQTEVGRLKVTEARNWETMYGMGKALEDAIGVAEVLREFAYRHYEINKDMGDRHRIETAITNLERINEEAENWVTH